MRFSQPFFFGHAFHHQNIVSLLSSKAPYRTKNLPILDFLQRDQDVPISQTILTDRPLQTVRSVALTQLLLIRNEQNANLSSEICKD